MKKHLFQLSVALGVSYLVLATASTSFGGVKKAAAAAAAANEAGALDEAYGLLARADHDYDGHRVRAMHQIEDAAHALGQKLGGHGKGDEKQGKSDAQVEGALTLLSQAVGGLKGKAHHHIEDAIKQLNIALKIQ